MATREKKAKCYKSDMERLDRLKDLIMQNADNGKIQLKVGDLLKILELQKKLSTDKNAEDKFWQMLEDIRKEELKDAE
jgi:hypothetical protein